MKTTVRAALIALVSLSAGSAAFGQQRDGQALTCTCVVGEATGTITQSVGDVLVTRRAGLSPATPGAQVGPSSLVTTGPDAEARVSFQLCQVELDENQQLSIAPVQGRQCAVVQATDGVVLADGGFSATGTLVTDKTIFGFALTGAVIGALISQ